jgi:HK97 family phage major capsid protein
MRMGTRVNHIPRVTGDVTVSYAGENATLTDSTLQFSQTSFTARKQYTYVKISNELLQDSAPDADSAIRTEAGRAMAIDRDKQMLLGNGQGGAPTGLANQTNVTTSSLAGTPTYANIVTGVQAVRALNGSTNVPVGQADCTGVVYNIQFEGTVLNLTDSNGRPLWEYGLSQLGRVPTPNWLGVPNWVGTNFIPTGDTASIFYGDWQYLLLMERQDIEVLASNVAGTAFASDQTWIRITYRYDVGNMHPEAFFVHSNAHA